MKEKELEKLNKEWSGKAPEEVLAYFLEHYRGRIVQSTSMGPEDQVITNMICNIDPGTRVVTLDTGRLPQETLDLIDKSSEHFGIRIEVFFPDFRKVQEMTGKHGVNLFYESIENRKMCCGIRKDEPIRRALKGQDAWICGLRKDQTVSRFFNKMVEWDEAHGLIKLNPLIDWTEKQVWAYIRSNKIPYNALHDQGYPSIGCRPCTRAVEPGEDSRAGRWWWEQSEQKECGLHNRDIKRNAV